MSTPHLGPRYLGVAICRDCGARTFVHFRKPDDVLIPRAHGRLGTRATRCLRRGGFVGPVRAFYYAWMLHDPRALELVGSFQRIGMRTSSP